MGTQQLLLLVVGFIVVMMMIYVGTSMYNSYAQQANRDILISTMNQLATNAQAYLRKPSSTGGGGGEFLNWDIPAGLKKAEFGTMRARVRNNRVNLVATGTELGYDGSNKIRVTLVVRESGITLRMNN